MRRGVSVSALWVFLALVLLLAIPGPVFAGSGQIIRTNGYNTGTSNLSSPAGQYINKMDGGWSGGWGRLTAFANGGSNGDVLVTQDGGMFFGTVTVAPGEHIIRIGPNGSDTLSVWTESGRAGDILVNGYSSYTWQFTDYTAPPGEYITGFTATSGGGYAYLTAVSTPFCSPPGTPGVPSFTGVTSQAVSVTWSDVANEAGYQVQRSPAGCGSWSNIGSQLGAGTTYFVDGSVSASTTYCYRVIAKGSSGCSDATGASASVTTDCTTHQGTPGMPTFANASTTAVTVRWNDVVGETGYQVQRAPYSAGACGAYANVGAQLPADTTSYTDGGLSPSTTYCYRIVSKGVTGCADRTGVSGTVTTTCGAGLLGNEPAKDAPETLLGVALSSARPSVHDVHNPPYLLDLAAESAREPDIWREVDTGHTLRLFKDMYFDAEISLTRDGDLLYAFRQDELPDMQPGDLLWHGTYDTRITIHRVVAVMPAGERTLQVQTRTVEPVEFLKNLRFDLQEHFKTEALPVFEMVEYPDGRVEKWTSDQKLLRVSRDANLRGIWAKPVGQHQRVKQDQMVHSDSGAAPAPEAAFSYGGEERMELPLINETDKMLFNGQDTATYSRDAYGNPVNMVCAQYLTAVAKEIRLNYQPVLNFSFDTVNDTTLSNAHVQLDGTLDFKALVHVDAAASCNLLYRGQPWRYTRSFFVWIVPMEAYLNVYPVIDASASASGWIQAGAQRQITHRVGYDYNQVNGWQGITCDNGQWICSDTGFQPYNPFDLGTHPLGDPTGENKPTWSFTGNATAEVRLEPHAGVNIMYLFGPRVIPTPSIRLSAGLGGAFNNSNNPPSGTYNYGVYGCFNAKFEFTFKGIFDNCSTSNGVKVEYFPNKNVEGTPTVCNEKTVPYISDLSAANPCGTCFPTCGAPGKNFSVRWTGMIEPRYNETYTIYLRANEGVRLWVDDKALIDDWNAGALRERSATFEAKAGQKYALKVEYFNGDGQANAVLWWSSPSQCLEMVPQGRYYPCAPYYTKTIYDNCWTLLAKTNGGDGLPADNNLDATQGAVVVGVPTLVSPIHGAYTNSLRPTFSWTAASGADNYEIMIGNDVFETNLLAFTPPRDIRPSVQTIWKVRGINTAKARRGLWSDERRLDIGYTVHTGNSYYGMIDIGNQVVVFDPKMNKNLTFRPYDIDSHVSPRLVLVNVYDGGTLINQMVVADDGAAELGSGSGLFIFAPTIFDSTLYRFAELMIAPTFEPDLSILAPQSGMMESATVRVDPTYPGEGVPWVDVGSPPVSTSTMKTLCYNGACSTNEEYAWTIPGPEGNQTMTVTMTDILGRTISRSVTVSYVPCKNPGVPAAPSFSGVTSSSVTLNWVDVGGDWGYRVQRSPAGCASWATIGSDLGVSTTSYTDTGLTAGTTYCYRVISLSCSGTDQPGASSSVATAALPRAVPDGRLSGTPMTSTRQTTSGDTIAISYDSTTCPSPQYRLYYGNLADIGSYTLAGSACNIGATGGVWSGVPSGNLFWIIVGDNGAGIEGSWGERFDGSAYSQRSATASGLCGNSAISVAVSCP